MTETHERMCLDGAELACEPIPKWLAANPGWHEWRELVCKPEFVGYYPPRARAIRERLESQGRIRVANGRSRGGRVVLVAHPTETTEPPRRLHARTAKAKEAKETRQREAAAQAAAMVALAEAFRRIEEHTCFAMKALERIAELLEHVPQGAVVYHPREEAPK